MSCTVTVVRQPPESRRHRRQRIGHEQVGCTRSIEEGWRASESAT